MMKTNREITEFSKVTITKRDFFKWLQDTLYSYGWRDIASNPANEGYIFHSKGEDGKQNILVQFRENYDNSVYIFSSTNSRYYDVRTMFSYEPNLTNGVNGISNPPLANTRFMRQMTCVKDDVLPEMLMNIYFNCNKDRMIYVIEYPFFKESTLLMFGKPTPHYSKHYKDVGNTIIGTSLYRYSNATSMGEADSTRVDAYDLTVMYNDIPKSILANSLYMSEIGVGSPTEGFKGYLEGIYSLNFDYNLNFGVNQGDVIYDSEGNEFTIINVNYYNSNYPRLVQKTPFYAICTKKAEVSL